MKSLLLTYDGRITRSQVWLAMLFFAALAFAVWLAMALLWLIIPGEIRPDGSYHVEGARAVPYVALALGYISLGIWSGVCVAIKRYHDRNKSGLWVLIQLVPIIGLIWYFIDVFCLRGTVGDNRFGPDPLFVQPPQTVAAA